MKTLPDLPPAWIERARAASIVEVVGRFFTVKRAGTFFRTLEHDSLVLSPRENRYHWYSKPGGGTQGQESGDPIDFLMRYGAPGGLSFPAAVRHLVHEDFPAWTPPAPTDDEERAEFSDLAERFHRKLTRSGYAWWAGRGVPAAVVDFLGLGESNFGYTLPIRNPFDGFRTVVNIKHRNRHPASPVRYISETRGSFLYVPAPAVLRHETLVLVGGEIKAVVLGARGIPTISSACGAATWMPEWGNLLAGKFIVIALDPGEEAQAARIQARMVEDCPRSVSMIATLPHPPDDFLLHHGGTVEALRRLLYLDKVRG